MNDILLTPANAYWNQRYALDAAKHRLKAMFEAVDSAKELQFYQWAQLYAFALAFQPDLILELGREMGNSTCVFTEAANNLQGNQNTRVISLCWSDKFMKITTPRLKERGIVDHRWFERLECHQTDILQMDYSSLFSGFERILVFWDAHGFEVAECVLGVILPKILNKRHYLLIHDLSDQRYMSREQLSYDGRHLWAGNSHGEARLVIGHVNSAVAQAISIVDFCSRNNLPLESADHSFHRELADGGKAEQMRRLLGGEMFSLQGHWFFLSLNAHRGPFTFPGMKASVKTCGRHGG